MDGTTVCVNEIAGKCRDIIPSFYVQLINATASFLSQFWYISVTDRSMLTDNVCLILVPKNGLPRVTTKKKLKCVNKGLKRGSLPHCLLASILKHDLVASSPVT